MCYFFWQLMLSWTTKIDQIYRWWLNWFFTSLPFTENTRRWNTFYQFEMTCRFILNSKSATWLHAEPKSAMHEQLAVNTQPYSSCRHTHTLYIAEDSVRLWLGSTLNSKKLTIDLHFWMYVTNLLIQKSNHFQPLQNFRFLEPVPAKVSVLRH